MDRKGSGLIALIGGQGDLGEDLLPRSPGLLEALEGGAVLQAEVCEVPVELLGVEGLCVWRGPLPERLGVGLGLLAEAPLGVGGPLGALAELLLWALLGAGVDLDLALAVLVFCRYRHLQGDRSLGGQDQGGLQGQLGDLLGAEPLGRVQGQLQEGGAGEQGGLGDGVICQPGVGGEGDPPGQGEPVSLGVFDRRSQQRVPGGGLSQRAWV